MLVTGALLVTSATALAGGLTLEERVQRLERQKEMAPAPARPVDTSGLSQRIDALEAALKKAPFGLKIGGMVVTSYLYDFNNPDSRLVSLRSFDRNDNTFSLDLFQLQVSREPGDDGVGFVTKVNFGKTAERMASDWDGDGSVGNVVEENNSIELEEAYITYNFPGLPELGFKAGKFVTPVGAEVIESPLNFNISRSLAFSWAIPFTHTGALGTFKTDYVSGILGVVNGWDNVIDSNDGKSVIGSVSVTPVDEFGITVGGLYGPEQADNGHSKRGLIDVVATVKPVETFTLSLNYDYGNESDVVGVRDGTAEWNAFAGIAAVDVPDAFVIPVGFALRGEYFDDSDGTRLPSGLDGSTPTFNVGQYQNAWEVTGTLKFVLAEGLMFRTEYRYDSAKHDIFEKELHRTGNFQNDQHTIAGELSYVF